MLNSKREVRFLDSYNTDTKFIKETKDKHSEAKQFLKAIKKKNTNEI
jgi:hypothetical protein